MNLPPLDADGINTLGAAVSRIAKLESLFENRARTLGRAGKVVLAGFAALELAVLVDIVRKRRLRRGWLLADSALAVVANLASTTLTGPDTGLDLRYAQVQALAVTAATTAGFAPVSIASVAVASAAWTSSLLVQRRRRPTQEAPVVAAALEPMLTWLALGALTRYLRGVDTELGDLREHQRRLAEAAVIETERERRHRLLHDTALQTLEAVAGDWYPDDASLRSVAAADADLLRRALAESPEVRDLDTALVEMVAAYRRAGLDIVFDRGGPGCGACSACRSPALAAELTAAAREAIVNSFKHASPCTTSVTAKCHDGVVAIRVSDDGKGFDVDTAPAGYGIEHSLRRRLAAVGGEVEIESSPGAGTTVRLSVPVPQT